MKKRCDSVSLTVQKTLNIRENIIQFQPDFQAAMLVSNSYYSSCQLLPLKLTQGMKNCFSPLLTLLEFWRENHCKDREEMFQKNLKFVGRSEGFGDFPTTSFPHLARDFRKST